MAMVWVNTKKEVAQELLRRLSSVAHNIDEIMQNETSPICAADIITELKKKFAFLSGGRGQDDSPIIIFPEFPSFGEISDEEFHNVLTYLTSVPSLSAAGVGFILVIDRRQDRWACVKGTLLPYLEVASRNTYDWFWVLRPNALLQRTLSDIFFKFHGDDFRMKVPSALTQELDGTQKYCHNTWISHRTDIEGFAVLVKRMTQRLQVFGRELAETERPNTPLASSNLLNTHSSKKDSMKEELARALLENLATVHRLLSQLNESSAAFDDFFWIQHQKKLELSLQLCQFEHSFQEVSSEMKLATDRLAAFSHVGISQTHTEHLLRDLTDQEDKSFEILDRMQALFIEGQRFIDNCESSDENVKMKCADLQNARDKLLQKLKANRGLLLHAVELHKKLQSVCKWCDDGIYMLASQQLDKCQSQEGAESALQELEGYVETGKELQQWDMCVFCREYESVLNKELKEQVERVLEKRALLQEMFEKRRISLKKLAAKQPRPVQPVAPTPEAIKSPPSSPALRHCGKSYASVDSQSDYNEVSSEQTDGGSRTASVSDEEENLAVLRRHVMNELLETERAYVEELLCVLQGYAAEMDNPAMASILPAALQNKKSVLFGNMQEIYFFHKTIFLKELETYTDHPELVGRCFLERMGDLQIYEKYCHNKPRSESLWRQCSDCVFFQECQKKLEHKLGLDSYLLKPVQRITKYQLLLKEMIKYSKGCDGVVELQAALSSLLGILKAVNDSMHLIAINGYEGNLGDLGRLLMQGSFSVWAEHKRGHVKMMDLARFKPMQRHLFLHEKALLFCKKREENGEGYEKAPSYSFKQELSMRAIGITEHAKGDHKKFEIWLSSRDEVYTVQAPSEEIKTTWVREIRKLLTGQLEACREASQQRPTAEDNSLERPARDGLSNGEVEKQRTEEEGGNEPNSLVDKKTDRARSSFSGSDNKPKRQDIKSDPTPLGWIKSSVSMDPSLGHDGYFVPEDRVTSEPEEEQDNKLDGASVSAVDEDPKATESQEGQP
ncbi:hypothetical protein Q7C36_009258 [Tachysurus vachellii]|uniref:Guanine nucleotide exchange factor DBS-like n=1 Tax=Tachysurus vachellii TaxID=175792 RepID=A0AA88N2P2_TACVA|nr:hypothetical protein Q7C36_009258 [Tachysurus vachellii]